jgi:GTP cyclohydrolase II
MDRQMPRNEPSPFGDVREVAVERAIGELRSARPFFVTDGDDAYLLLAVDGADDGRIDGFFALCAPQEPALVIAARRARALGIETAVPVAITLPRAAAVSRSEMVHSLAAEIRMPEPHDHSPAAPALCAALDLAKLAQRLPALLAVKMDADDRKLPAFSVAEVRADAIGEFRRAIAASLAIVSEARVPLEGGIASRFVIFRNRLGGDAVAIVVGAPDFSNTVPVRLHSACLTGDVFGSRRCDCGDQLRIALRELSAIGGGVILYLDQEGRGLGLANKMRAYALQDEGLDTVDANMSLGFDDDERDYDIAAQMLRILGCHRVEMFTNNPAKLSGLAHGGIEVVARKPLLAPVTGDNRRYLATKAARAGHRLDDLFDGDVLAEVPGRQ